MSSQYDDFLQPTLEQTRRWYSWIFSFNHQRNPFHPVSGDEHLNTNQPKDIFFLSAITATTEPAYKPVEISALKAIVARSGGTTVYDDGNGKPVQQSPKISPRTIRLSDIGQRNLYVPVSTELATETKYPRANLFLTAMSVMERENVNGIPPIYFELNGTRLDGGGLKNYLVYGSIEDINIGTDNVGMLPSGGGKAAFYDYAVVVRRAALRSTGNTLEFGVKGKFFECALQYQIK